uniref:Uncharacterized protein n=1 Tax=Acrobeloides nanus TaxID=290746 RepID=A0A914CW15_9BILA
MASRGLKNITNTQQRQQHNVTAKVDVVKSIKICEFPEDDENFVNLKVHIKSGELENKKEGLKKTESLKNRGGHMRTHVLTEKFEIFEENAKVEVQSIGIQASPSQISTGVQTEVTVPLRCPDMPIEDLWAPIPTTAYLRRLAERLQKDIEREREELFDLMYKKNKLDRDNAKIEQDIQDCINYARRELKIANFGVEDKSPKEEKKVLNM